MSTEVGKKEEWQWIKLGVRVEGIKSDILM